MSRSLRPFRSQWSVLLVLATLVLTAAACFGSDSNGPSDYCSENPENC